MIQNRTKQTCQLSFWHIDSRQLIGKFVLPFMPTIGQQLCLFWQDDEKRDEGITVKIIDMEIAIYQSPDETIPIDVDIICEECPPLVIKYFTGWQAGYTAISGKEQ